MAKSLTPKTPRCSVILASDIDWNTVKIGEGCYVGPGCVLRNCELRDNVHLEAYVSIGADPEIAGFRGDNFGVLVCSGVRVSEFVTVHGGSVRQTLICSHALIFRHAHVAHDCFVGEQAIVSGGASMCGHSMLSSYATLSAHAVLHQYAVVGAGAFVGAGAVVSRHVLPLDKVMGRPPVSIGPNLAKASLVDFDSAMIDFTASLERTDPCDGNSKETKVL